MTEPVLALSTLAPDRAFITIDGTEYHLRAAIDVDLVITARVLAVSRRMSIDFSALTEKQATEYIVAVDEGVQAIMYDPIPAEVLGKLDLRAKFQIIEAFRKATQRAGSPPNRKARRARSTSPSSSPA